MLLEESARKQESHFTTRCRKVALCSREQNLKVILEAYNRALFDFPFDHFPLEAEYHIRGALKKSPVFFPAHAASAVLQSDKLLFHFPAASGADFIAFSHEATPLIKNLIYDSGLYHF